MHLEYDTFRMGTDKEAVMKVLEEASEVHGSWQHDPDTIADELADCIQACCNLAARYGIDLQDAIDRVERRNRERGRYE